MARVMERMMRGRVRDFRPRAALASRGSMLRWWQAWFAGVGTTAVLYSLGSVVGGTFHVLPELALDRLIGYHPAAVGVYLSFFVLQAVAFWAVPEERRVALTRAFASCALAAFLVFIVWPTTLVQPPAPASDTLALALVRWADTPANCLPSLHAALSAVSAAALTLRRNAWVSVLAWLWALAICWSAIATRQHLSIDIAAGWALGCTAAFGFLRGTWLRARAQCAND